MPELYVTVEPETREVPVVTATVDTLYCCDCHCASCGHKDDQHDYPHEDSEP